MPTTLSVSPLIVCPNVCMPIARFGLIHIYIAFPYPNALLQRACQCVGACVYACACGMRVYVRVTKGGLKACVCLHVSVCTCVCKCMHACVCVCHTHAHTIMVD